LTKDFLGPIKEGTQHGAAAGRHVGKELASTVEAEFLNHVTRTFSKASDTWSTFDKIVDTRLGGMVQKAVADLGSDIQRMEAEKGTRAAKVEAAKGAITAAEEKAKAMEEACGNAATKAKGQKESLKQQRRHTRKDSMKSKRRMKLALMLRSKWMTSQRGHLPHSPSWRRVQLHHHQRSLPLPLHPSPRSLCNQLQRSSPGLPWQNLQACWAWLRRLCATCFHLLVSPHLRQLPRRRVVQTPAAKWPHLLASPRQSPRLLVAKWPRLHGRHAITESLRMFPVSASPGMLRTPDVPSCI